jgi:hypothetical protein
MKNYFNDYLNINGGKLLMAIAIRGLLHSLGIFYIRVSTLDITTYLRYKLDK